MPTVSVERPVARLLTALLVSALTFAFAQNASLAQKRNRKPAKTVASVAKNLVLTPQALRLSGAYDEGRLLAQGKTKTGELRDVSDEAKVTIADTSVAFVDSDGVVRGRKDGKTEAVVRWGKETVRVPVEVLGVSKTTSPRFLVEVMPLMSRLGCNMGACHGAAQGKGGFRLSLLGYDPEADYEAITRANSARRVSPSQPDNSLFLRKPAMGVAHRGGLRLRYGTPEYRLLRDWIAGGMVGPAKDEPEVVSLEVFPKVKTLKRGEAQRLQVWANYSDGSKRDVTRQTLFTASDEATASVTPGGVAKATGPGEGAALIRFQSLVTTAQIISPYGAPRTVRVAKKKPDTDSLKPQGAEMIDRLVEKKLASLGLVASERCSDSDFLRRVSLDVIGLLPTPDEARAFLKDRDPQKRAKLIESLLRRPEYTDFWAMQWSDILRVSRQRLNEKGMIAFRQWIQRSVAENKPWDKFVREMLLAQGSAYLDGAANFYRTANSPGELAETAAQAFLGVRIQCAKCHNHPYDKWTQKQYYQMAAFFARVGAKGGERPDERVFFAKDSGEVTHPKTGQNVIPAALGASPLNADYAGDRRAALATWITSSENPFFAKIFVNRVWRRFMGRGLVEPVDDLRQTNPPTNAELFEALATYFTRSGYDAKALMRAILYSEVYQRSALPMGNNAGDTRYHSRFAFKRMGAEQLLDAIASATGVPEKFPGLPMGLRAAQLPDAGVGSYFLDLFGRPARNITCECERSDDPNLGQVLHLMNNAALNERIGSKSGRIAQLVGEQRSLDRTVEELYLATFSRTPTLTERRKGVLLLAFSPDRARAAEDLLWALMNSKEFLFNH